MSDFETIIRNPKEFGDRLLDLKNRNKFCDVEILVDTKRIAVHKNILASSSEYFETIFCNNESLGELSMENKDSEIVQSLLEYCYTGIIRVSGKKLQETILLANFLKMTPIIEGCIKTFEKKMNSSNCISTWKLAQLGYFKSLKTIAFEYARQNFEKVSQTQDFLNLTDSEIVELLSSNIIVANETIVFDSVQKWIKHDSASRKQHLDKLTNYIRFEYIPGNILSSEFRSFCYDNSSIECFNKIWIAHERKDEEKPMSFNGNIRDSYDLNTLMVIGSSYNSMEIFDLKNKKWTKIENFKFEKRFFGAVMLEHKLMLIGGRVKTGIDNTVQSYDLSTGTMESLPPMKYGREDLSALEIKGRVYAIGGYNNEPLPYVEMWDPTFKIWKELSSMSTSRRECKAGVLDEDIFVVGGNNGNYLSEVESYNLTTDKWTKRASMNEKRYAPGVAVVGGYLYVAGGKSESGVHLATAERYDPKIDKWTLIHPLNFSRCYLGAGKLMGKFVIVGGQLTGSRSATMEMYDDENDNWIPMPSLIEPREDFGAVEIPWKLATAVFSREVPK